jgi:hypothetical protein
VELGEAATRTERLPRGIFNQQGSTEVDDGGAWHESVEFVEGWLGEDVEDNVNLRSKDWKWEKSSWFQVLMAG